MIDIVTALLPYLGERVAAHFAPALLGFAVLLWVLRGTAVQALTWYTERAKLLTARDTSQGDRDHAMMRDFYADLVAANRQLGEEHRATAEELRNALQRIRDLRTSTNNLRHTAKLRHLRSVESLRTTAIRAFDSCLMRDDCPSREVVLGAIEAARDDLEDPVDP